MHILSTLESQENPLASGIYLPIIERAMDRIGGPERLAGGHGTRGLGAAARRPVMAEFLAHYPEIDAPLFLIDHNDHFVEGHVDVAVRLPALGAT